MTARIQLDPAKHREIYTALFGLGAVIRRSGLEPALLALVKVRASQINGCGFCLDMHTKEARAEGETEQRLYLTGVWHETSIYNERERAALLWTEAVTRLGQQGVPDDVYETVSNVFSEKEMTALTLAVVEINAWNRFAISFKRPVGDYVVGSVKPA